MATTEKKAVKRYTLPEGQVTYDNMLEKTVFKDGDKPKYKVELRFDPKLVTGAGTIEDALIDAACDKWGDGAEKQFLEGKILSPILDGDKLAARRVEDGKSGDFYAGYSIIRPTTQFNRDGQDAPGGISVYAPDVSPIEAVNHRKEIYAGVWGIAAVTIFTYLDSRGDKAVGFYLEAFQKTKDGERLIAPVDRSTLFKPMARTTAAPTGGDTSGTRRRRAG